MEIIRSQDEFYVKAHRLIYASIISLHMRGRQVGRVALIDDLKVRGLLDEAGGMTYVVDLAANYVTGARTRDLAEIVHEKHLFRELARTAAEIERTALSAQGDVREILSDAERKILELGLGADSGGLEVIGRILKLAADEIVRRNKLQGEISGVTTGFRDLDAMLGGFQKSDLVLLAARPSMGKTAIALNFAVSAAAADKRVAVFSLEMSKEQLAMRIFSQLTNIDLTKILRGDLEGEDWKRISGAMNRFSARKLRIDDTSGASLIDIRSKLRKMKTEEGLDLVMIDYLQLMEAGRAENRQQEISKISRGLKAIAKELEVPVIALSQLSRAPEQRADHRPILSDLRESGAIEQDADVVMFLYRDEYYNPDSEERGTGEVIIAKHRNGPTGSIKLTYKAANTKFVDCSLRAEV